MGERHSEVPGGAGASRAGPREAVHRESEGGDRRGGGGALRERPGLAGVSALLRDSTPDGAQVRRPEASPAFMSVEVVGTTGGGLSLVSPDRYRVEGLAAADVAE